MPRPTEPVKRVCYADDLTVWATGVKVPDLEESINSYREEISAYLKVNSLLISAPKSPVTLFSPDPHPAKTNPGILIEYSQLPLVQCPKILGVYLDTSLSFNKHSGYVAERVSNRNNIIKALAGTSWGQQKENTTDDLQGSWEIDHQLCCTCLEYKPTRHKLQKHPIYTERGSEYCHWLLQDVQYRPPTHNIEAEMVKVKDHSELQSAQDLARCREPGNVCHSITARETPMRWIKQTLFTRHHNTVEPMMLADNRKATLQAIYTLTQSTRLSKIRQII